MRIGKPSSVWNDVGTSSSCFVRSLRGHVGTAALGCPAEATLPLFLIPKRVVSPCRRSRPPGILHPSKYPSKLIRVNKRSGGMWRSVPNRDVNSAETALLSNSLGTKTNEFNCYHSSHFHR
jgi:hypothetical protein